MRWVVASYAPARRAGFVYVGSQAWPVPFGLMRARTHARTTRLSSVLARQTSAPKKRRNVPFPPRVLAIASYGIAYPAAANPLRRRPRAIDLKSLARSLPGHNQWLSFLPIVRQSSSIERSIRARRGGHRAPPRAIPSPTRHHRAPPPGPITGPHHRAPSPGRHHPAPSRVRSSCNSGVRGDDAAACARCLGGNGSLMGSHGSP